MSDYEFANVGVQYDNMWDDDFSFGSSLGMMFVDFWLCEFHKGGKNVISLLAVLTGRMAFLQT